MGKKICLLFLLFLFSFASGIAETVEEDIPEGLYIYAPTAGKYLPWMEA